MLFPDDAEFATATGTIRDNDGAPMIGIVTTTPSVTEADTAELVITASAEQTRALEVQLTLAEQCRADGSRGNFLGGPGDGSTPGGGCPLDGGTPGTGRTISIAASLSSTSGGSSNSVTPTTIPVTPTTIRTGQYLLTITIAAGNSTATLQLTLDDDGIDESDGSIHVAINERTDTGSGTNRLYQINPAASSATVQVADNDASTLRLAALPLDETGAGSGTGAATTVTITEGQDALFVVTATTAQSAALTVSLSLADAGPVTNNTAAESSSGGTTTPVTLTAAAPDPANPGTNSYTASLVMAAGSSTVTLKLPTVMDAEDKPNGMVTATIQSGQQLRLLPRPPPTVPPCRCRMTTRPTPIISAMAPASTVAAAPSTKAIAVTTMTRRGTSRCTLY